MSIEEEIEMKKKFFLLMLVAIMVSSVSSVQAFTCNPLDSMRVTSKYGASRDGGKRKHAGIDLSAKSPKNCYAVEDGTVILVSSSNARGKYIVIDIGQGYGVLYEHLSETKVKNGDVVKAGQVVALSGNTGKYKENGVWKNYVYHLHFEVIKNPKAACSSGAVSTSYGTNTEDPVPYISGSKKNMFSSGSSSTGTNSGSTESNKCGTCGYANDTKWYVTPDGTHYRKCTGPKEHNYDIGQHKYDTTGVCVTCKLPKSAVVTKNNSVSDITNGNKSNNVTINSGSTESNKCRTCGYMNDTKWYATPDGTHYKKCTGPNEHNYSIGQHIYNAAGVCVTCKLPKGKVVTENDSVNNIINGNKQNNTKTGRMIYKDLSDAHWAADEIEPMKDAGIVSGYEDGTFRPDNTVTAEEFIVLVGRVVEKKGLPQASGDVYLAKDLKNEWSFSKYQSLAKVIAKKSGETKELGKKDLQKVVRTTWTKSALEEYRSEITREEAAYIMGALGFESTTSSNVLNAIDWNKVDDECKKRISGLANKKIFQGGINADGTISVNPKSVLTRAEAAALVNRLYNNL